MTNMTSIKDDTSTKDDTKDIIENKVDIILRQTNYTKEEATQLLINNNNDEVCVIKKYLGITSVKEVNNKQNISLNQEIYKQFRKKLVIPLKT